VLIRKTAHLAGASVSVASFDLSLAKPESARRNVLPIDSSIEAITVEDLMIISW